MTGLNRFSRFLIGTGVLLLGLAACASFDGNIPITVADSGARYISPKNADGIQDELSLTVEFPAVKGLKISSYQFSIVTDDGAEVYSIGAEAGALRWYQKLFRGGTAVSLPDEIIWDGRNNAGALVADGVYYLTGSATDSRGNRGELVSLPIIVDDTPPSVLLELPFTVFSPNQDGAQERLDIYFQQATSEDRWEGSIRNSEGAEIRGYIWNGTPQAISWDGSLENGTMSPDGEYGFRVSATDKAGNRFESETPTLVKDSRLPPISISLDGNLLSPNGDGVMDSLELRLEAENPQGITSAVLSLIDRNGRVLAALPAPRNYPFVHTLTGIFSGRPVPDGIYYIRFEVGYTNGATPAVVSTPVEIDTRPPYAVVSAPLLLFSPDGDGRRDTLLLNQTSEEAVAWTGTLRSSGGSVVLTREWGARADSIEWDGRDATGRVVPDGIYSYTLSGSDAAGNRTQRTIPGIRIDTRPTPVALRLLDSGFSPNDDGISDSARFTPVVEIREGVTAWLFEVTGNDSSPIYSLKGTDLTELPKTIPWNGAGAAEGSYGGRLTVEYEKGNIAISDSPERVILDLSGPVLSADLRPLPFSPDGDGNADSLTVVLSATDPAGIMQRSAQIIDPAGNPFVTVPTAAFAPGGWLWNGTSSRNELVQSASDYTVSVTATDMLGNKSSLEERVPIDILVIRDGDRLKISISSIYFKPNTADYIGISPELAARNIATLDRLAEVLKRYSDYRILLEGHGVRIYWDQPARWPSEEKEVLVPLSRNRATAIKAALSTRGIRNDRMSIAGYGGSRPVVPHGDLDNRWKNRRVEFILLK